MPEFAPVSENHPGIPEARKEICRRQVVENSEFAEAVRQIIELEESHGTGPREVIIEAAIQVRLSELLGVVDEKR